MPETKIKHEEISVSVEYPTSMEEALSQPDHDQG